MDSDCGLMKGVLYWIGKEDGKCDLLSLIFLQYTNEQKWQIHQDSGVNHHFEEIICFANAVKLHRYN